MRYEYGPKDMVSVWPGALKKPAKIKYISGYFRNADDAVFCAGTTPVVVRLNDKDGTTHEVKILPKFFLVSVGMGGKIRLKKVARKAANYCIFYLKVGGGFNSGPDLGAQVSPGKVFSRFKGDLGPCYSLISTRLYTSWRAVMASIQAGEQFYWDVIRKGRVA